MNRVLPLIFFAFACAPTEPSSPDVGAMIEQSALPGALTMTTPLLYAGEPTTLTITGAAPGERVYVGMSTAGVVPRSICPAILQDCLNLSMPVSLLGQAVASSSGVAEVSFTVPMNALYSSIFLQAAAFTGTSSVAHRFIEPPDSDCGVGIAPPRCAPVHEEAGSWTCALGTSCQDVYDVYLTAGTEVTVDVTGVTGQSVVRLAAFTPGTPLNGTNLFTSTNADSECGGQNVDASQSFEAAADGVYRIAVGRDWGSSAGAVGTYDLTLSASPGLDFRGRSVDDGASLAAGSQCGHSWSASGSWNCPQGTTCQDVYDVPLQAGDAMEIAVTGVTGQSVVRLGLFEPGATLGSRNLLTGTTADRECFGQNASDSVTTWVAPRAGTYRLAIGRDWGSSAGFTGSYRLELTSSEPITATATANDVATSLAASQCAFGWTVDTGWSCALGVSCQDIFDMNLPAGSQLTVNHTAITGSSVSRLAVFGPRTVPSGVNLLTGTNTDQECHGQNVSQVGGPLSIGSGGTHRVAVGRDWGSSAGAVGNYTATFVVTGGFPYVTQTSNDSASQASGTSCP